MKNETKAALAMGLVIIVGFGFVLNHVKGSPPEGGSPSAELTGGRFTSHALQPLVDDVKPEDYRRQPERAVLPVRHASRRAAGPAPRAAVRPVARRTYTVQPRDTLARIARRVYGSGDAKYYELIFQANRDKLSDISKVRAGQVLAIPAPPAGAPVRSARFVSGSPRGLAAMGAGDGTR